MLLTEFEVRALIERHDEGVGRRHFSKMGERLKILEQLFGLLS
jgi:hypothetical protein